MPLFSRSVMSYSLQPHELQHSRFPCPSQSLGVCSNSCPLSRWCHPTISSSVIPFSSRLHPFPASRSFPMSQFFASGDQSTGVSASASVLPMKDWTPLGWTGWISLQSKGLSRVFSSTTVRKRHVFSAQPSLWLRERVGQLSKAPKLVQTPKPHEFWVKQSGSRGYALTHHTWLSRATKFGSQVPKIG